MSRSLIVAAASVAIAASASSAFAAPVYSAVTGSYYDYINRNLEDTAYVEWTWEEAAADAAQRTYMGRTGHLVTITSATEEQILYTYWLGDINAGQPFIGAFRAPDSDPQSGWQWVTGEAFAYAHWRAGEPNNDPTNNPPPPEGYERYVHYLDAGGWNDVPGRYRSEYFIEYSVPAPAGLALLGIGALGLLATSRRRPR
jgi:hypothetical protein